MASSQQQRTSGADRRESIDEPPRRQAVVAQDHLASSAGAAPAEAASTIMAAATGLSDPGTLSAVESPFHQPPRPDGSVFGSGNSENSPHNGRLADAVMRTVVSSENDALRLLFQAAEQNHDSSPAYNSIRPEQEARLADHYTPSTQAAESIDLSRSGTDALLIWGAFRFTKMGWLTAQEAITYMDR